LGKVQLRFEVVVRPVATHHQHTPTQNSATVLVCNIGGWENAVRLLIFSQKIPNKVQVHLARVPLKTLSTLNETIDGENPNGKEC